MPIFDTNALQKAGGSDDLIAGPADLVHRNPFGLVVRPTFNKGRGVFATRTIPAGVLVDICPVMLFGRDDYEAHAKHTIVADYAFVWGEGKMALAMGLGSIMNHSNDKPNVSYVRDKKMSSLNFMTTSLIQPGDELCIYYGKNLWFQVDDNGRSEDHQSRFRDNGLTQGLEIDGFSSIMTIDVDSDSDASSISFIPSPKEYKYQLSDSSAVNDSQTLPTPSPSQDSTSPIIMKEELPFDKLKFPDELESESDDGPVPTTEIWAVDVYDTKWISPMIEHIRINTEEYQADALKQLKRVKRVEDPNTRTSKTAFAVSPFHSLTSPPPPFPAIFAPYHSQPYVVTVPSTPAKSQRQLTRKSALWPVGFFPTLDRGKKVKQWTREEVDWVKDGLTRVARLARRVNAESGELPIAAYVTRSQWSTHSSDSEEAFPILPPPQTWSDHDTRNSLQHPLRHACMNIIRRVAGSQSDLPTPSILTLTPAYLLTSYTLFLTHEPCIMCTMALLHSRVKDVFYIFPMSKTGGCGGLVEESVPGLKGVNHRFGIFRWKEERLAELDLDLGAAELAIDSSVDV